MSKALNVTSIAPWGEHTISHPISEAAPQDMMVIALLQGVIKAGHAIKSFEVVEV